MMPPGVYRFGVFEVDPRAGELRKSGVRLKIPGQPFQVLVTLLENAGQVVTREQMRSALWPKDTFVDFESGLNTAVKGLREVLGDSAERPLFIETLPRRGYRFVAPVTQNGASRTIAANKAGSLANRNRFPRIWIMVVVVLLLAGVRTFAWLNRSFPPPRVLGTTQVTHDGFDKTNSLTDGSRLYITESTGSRQFLVQVSVAGGETSIIPTPFTNITISDISPDHSRLLVADAVGTENDGQVWVLPLPTGAPRRLGDVVAHWNLWSPGWAVWSPDGRRIAFARNSKIYLSDADGASIRELVALSGPASEICFSPDGTRLRFTVWSRQHDSPLIWEVGSDGTNLHPVFPKWQSPPAEIAGAWSGDGRYYFFTTCDNPNRCSIWVMHERAGPFHSRTLAPVQLTTSPTPVFFNGVSPDGKIVFAGTWSPRTELVRYDARSRQFAPFLGGISNASDLDFSRDGKWVAYVSDPDRTLWRSRVDGSERLQLTAPPVSVALPHWSPDGAQIAYVDERYAGPYWRIFLTSAQGGTPLELLSENRNQLDPSWSPDGKQLVFGRVPWLDGSAGKISIQIFDLRSKQVATIPGSEDLFCPRWSPDGQHLAAMSVDRRKLVLFDFKTKKWADWTNEPGTIGYPAWSRDGRYIYYDSSSNSNPTYRRIKIGQSRSEFLIDLKGLKRATGSLLGPWSGIAPGDSPLFDRDLSTAEIYALKLELP
jgi:Tol biopolymer transport system component/DNA-binding winged helix-turn-helix (wHTH) protein